MGPTCARLGRWRIAKNGSRHSTDEAVRTSGERRELRQRDDPKTSLRRRSRSRARRKQCFRVRESTAREGWHFGAFLPHVSSRSGISPRTALDLVWCDEEPADYEIYSECLSRISGTDGSLMIGFTPLRGMSEISLRFRNEFSPDRTYVQMGIDDVPADGHIAPEDRARIIAGYPVHERDARSKGEPMLGEGKIYQTPEADIIEDLGDPLKLPRYWRWGYGLDIGINHPTGIVLMVWDIDQDVLHVVAELRVTGATPGQHFALIRGLEMRLFGRHMNFPIAWPADAGTRDKGSGEPVKNLYAQYGLRMLHEHATHPNAKGAAATSLEGGIAEIDLREKNGKWKVARSCVCYLEERRLYHRKDGEVVRLRDDVLSAARCGAMMKRFFKEFPQCDPWEGSTVAGWPSGGPSRHSGPQYAKGTPNHPDGDMDVFSGS